MALSLIYCGAQGSTAAALKTGLSLENFPTKSAVADEFYYLLTPFQNVNSHSYGVALLQIGNAIYVRDGYDIRSSFRQIAMDQFYSKVGNVNFADQQNAVQTINNWVSNETAK